MPQIAVGIDEPDDAGLAARIGAGRGRAARAQLEPLEEPLPALIHRRRVALPTLVGVFESVEVPAIGESVHVRCPAEWCGSPFILREMTRVGTTPETPTR